MDTSDQLNDDKNVNEPIQPTRVHLLHLSHPPRSLSLPLSFALPALSNVIRLSSSSILINSTCYENTDAPVPADAAAAPSPDAQFMPYAMWLVSALNLKIKTLQWLSPVHLTSDTQIHPWER